MLEPCMGLVCLYFWAMHNRSWKLVLGHQVDARGTYWLHVPTDTETCQVDAGISWLGAGPVQLEDNQDPKRSWPASCSELCLPQLHNPDPVASFRTYAQVKWKLTSLATSLAVTTVSSHLLRWSVSESLACSRARKRCRGYPALEDVLTTGIYVLARFEGPSVVPAE